MGTRCADHVTPLYPQKLALTSPTGGGRSVGIVRVRTKATEFSFYCFSTATMVTRTRLNVTLIRTYNACIVGRTDFNPTAASRRMCLKYCLICSSLDVDIEEMADDVSSTAGPQE